MFCKYKYAYTLPSWLWNPLSPQYRNFQPFSLFSKWSLPVKNTLSITTPLLLSTYYTIQDLSQSLSGGISVLPWLKSNLQPEQSNISSGILTPTRSDLVCMNESIGMEILQCKVTEWPQRSQEKSLEATRKVELNISNAIQFSKNPIFGKGTKGCIFFMNFPESRYCCGTPKISWFPTIFA